MCVVSFSFVQDRMCDQPCAYVCVEERDPVRVRTMQDGKRELVRGRAGGGSFER